MERLNLKERQLALRIFETCHRIAHRQGGTDQDMLDQRVSQQWRLCAITISNEIVVERNRFFSEEVEKELNA